MASDRASISIRLAAQTAEAESGIATLGANAKKTFEAVRESAARVGPSLDGIGESASKQASNLETLAAAQMRVFATLRSQPPPAVLGRGQAAEVDGLRAKVEELGQAFLAGARESQDFANGLGLLQNRNDVFASGTQATVRLLQERQAMSVLVAGGLVREDQAAVHLEATHRRLDSAYGALAASADRIRATLHPSLALDKLRAETIEQVRRGLLNEAEAYEHLASAAARAAGVTHQTGQPVAASVAQFATVDARTDPSAGLAQAAIADARASEVLAANLKEETRAKEVLQRQTDTLRASISQEAAIQQERARLGELLAKTDLELAEHDRLLGDAIERITGARAAEARAVKEQEAAERELAAAAAAVRAALDPTIALDRERAALAQQVEAGVLGEAAAADKLAASLARVAGVKPSTIATGLDQNQLPAVAAFTDVTDPSPGSTKAAVAEAREREALAQARMADKAAADALLASLNPLAALETRIAEIGRLEAASALDQAQSLRLLADAERKLNPAVIESNRSQEAAKTLAGQLVAQYQPLVAVEMRLAEIDQAVAKGGLDAATGQRAKAQALKDAQAAASALERGGGGGGRGQLNFQLQNASFQVTDFFTQLSSGTRISVALSQQLPQLLGGFGLIGAAAGAAASLVGILFTAFESLSGGYEAATKAAKAYGDETDQLLARLKVSVETADKFRETLARLDQQQTALATSSIQDRLDKETTAYDASTKALNDYIDALIKRSRVGVQEAVDATGGVQAPKFDDLVRAADRLEDVKRSFAAGDPKTTIDTLREAITNLAVVAGETLGSSLSNSQDRIRAQGNEALKTASAIDEHKHQMELLAAEATLAIDPNNAYAKSILNQGHAFDQASTAANGYAAALRAAASATPESGDPKQDFIARKLGGVDLSQLTPESRINATEDLRKVYGDQYDFQKAADGIKALSSETERLNGLQAVNAQGIDKIKAAGEREAQAARQRLVVDGQITKDDEAQIARARQLGEAQARLQEQSAAAKKIDSKGQARDEALRKSEDELAVARQIAGIEVQTVGASQDQKRELQAQVAAIEAGFKVGTAQYQQFVDNRAEIAKITDEMKEQVKVQEALLALREKAADRAVIRDVDYASSFASRPELTGDQVRVRALAPVDDVASAAIEAERQRTRSFGDQEIVVADLTKRMQALRAAVKDVYKPEDRQALIDQTNAEIDEGEAVATLTRLQELRLQSLEKIRQSAATRVGADAQGNFQTPDDLGGLSQEKVQEAITRANAIKQALAGLKVTDDAEGQAKRAAAIRDVTAATNAQIEAAKREKALLADAALRQSTADERLLAVALDKGSAAYYAQIDAIDARNAAIAAGKGETGADSEEFQHDFIVNLKLKRDNDFRKQVQDDINQIKLDAILEPFKQIPDLIANGISSGFDALAEGKLSGKDFLKGFHDSILSLGKGFLTSAFSGPFKALSDELSQMVTQGLKEGGIGGGIAKINQFGARGPLQAGFVGAGIGGTIGGVGSAVAGQIAPQTQASAGAGIGGLAGGIAGGLIGGILLPGVGAVAGAAIGGFLGTAAGGLLGGLIGTSESNNRAVAQYSPGGPDLKNRIGKGGGVFYEDDSSSPENRRQVNQIADQLAAARRALASVGGQFGFTKYEIASGDESGLELNGKKYSTPEALIKAAIKQLAAGANVKGDATLATVLKNTRGGTPQELQEDIQFARQYDEITGKVGEYGKGLRALNTQFEQAAFRAEELGLSVKAVKDAQAEAAQEMKDKFTLQIKQLIGTAGPFASAMADLKDRFKAANDDAAALGFTTKELADAQKAQEAVLRIQFTNQYNVLTGQAGGFAQAMAQIAENFRQAAALGRDLGKTDDLAKLQKDAETKLREQYRRQVDQLTGTGSGFGQALADLRDRFKQAIDITRELGESTVELSQKQIQAERDLAAESVRSLVEQQRSAAEQIRGYIEGIITPLKQSLSGLGGLQGILAPQQSIASGLAEFRDTLAKARADDPTALASIAQLGPQLLNYAKQQLGTGADFAAILAEVTGGLQEVLTAQQARGDAVTQSIPDTLRQTAGEQINTLRDGFDKVTEELAKTRAAIIAAGLAAPDPGLARPLAAPDPGLARALAAPDAGLARPLAAVPGGRVAANNDRVAQAVNQAVNDNGAILGRGFTRVAAAIEGQAASIVRAPRLIADRVADVIGKAPRVIGDKVADVIGKTLDSGTIGIDPRDLQGLSGRGTVSVDPREQLGFPQVIGDKIADLVGNALPAIGDKVIDLLGKVGDPGPVGGDPREQLGFPRTTGDKVVDLARPQVADPALLAEIRELKAVIAAGQDAATFGRRDQTTALRAELRALRDENRELRREVRTGGTPTGSPSVRKIA